MADTGSGKNKILKCLKELEEDVHLIERKKQGQYRYGFADATLSL